MASGLRQGQRLPTRFVVESHPNVLMVQRGPFLEESGGQYAYVVHGNRAVRRPIQVTAINAGAVEVADGLHAGDAIVVSGLGDASRPEITLTQ